MSHNGGILADTGFWIALYETRDPAQHRAARDFFRSVSAGQWLFPFPLHYEILRTRFVARPQWLESFHREFKSLRVLTIEDRDYREAALSNTITGQRGRKISLADSLVREILISGHFRVTAVVATNPEDFNDVCGKARVKMLTIE